MAEKKEQSAFPYLKITFGGLCSFVEERANGTTKQVHTLLVAASNSSVRRPRLCRHDRYLIFSAQYLKEASGEFYTAFVGRDPNGQVDSLCFWNIDGCDIDILPNGMRDPGLPPISYEPSGILNLDNFDGGRVDPKWLDEDPGGLIGARLRLAHGRLKAGVRVEEDWVMCYENDDQNCAPQSRRDNQEKFSQTVDLDLFNDGVNISYVDIVADNFKESSQQSIRLGFRKPRKEGESVFLSIANICPPEPHSDREVVQERDVLAFYDLCQRDLSQNRRRIPRIAPGTAADKNPRRSYCPIVQQSLGGS